MRARSFVIVLCFFKDTATTEIYTLSLHDALPISRQDRRRHPLHRNRPDRSQSSSPPTPGAAPASHPRRGGRHRPCASGDRKSTRLNSSHANISYAVFCLKKKKSTPNLLLNIRIHR